MQRINLILTDKATLLCFPGFRTPRRTGTRPVATDFSDAVGKVHEDDSRCNLVKLTAIYKDDTLCYTSRKACGYFKNDFSFFLTLA